MTKKSIYFFYLIFLIFATYIHAQKLTLEHAIDLAIKNNPDIINKVNELKAEKARFWDVISPENPHLFIEHEGIPKSRHNISEFTERKIGVSQEIEFPMTYIFKGRIQYFEKKRYLAKYQNLVLEVEFDVKKCFYELLLLQEKKKLFENIYHLTRQLHEKANIRVQAGESTPYDLLKVNVDLVEVENKLIEMNNHIDIKIQTLKFLLGKKDDQTIQIEGELRYAPTEFQEDSLRLITLRENPSIKQGTANVNKFQASHTLAWVNVLPKFEIRYFQQQFREESPLKSWGGEIGLSIPLWFGLKNQGHIRTTKHELEAARWQLESQKRSALLQLTAILSTLQLAEQHVKNYQEHVLTEVEELVRIATRSYEEGEMGYLEVAEALKTLYRTRIAYFDAIFNYLIAKADLERTSSTLFTK